MRILIVYNYDFSKVLFRHPKQTKEIYPIETINKIADALKIKGHYVETADGNLEIINRLKNFFSRGKGIVFNLSYGIQGEDRYAHIPSILEMLGVPYTGSSPEGHTLALDKAVAKIIFRYYSIPTPDFQVFSSSDQDFSNIKFPAIVKPLKEALSLGITVVRNVDELKKAVSRITEEFHQDAIVEKFIRGREFSVGIIGNDEDLETLPVLEFDFGGDPDAIQTTYLKRHKPIKKICPADIPEETAKRMQYLTKRAFHVLGLRDYARADIRMDLDGNIYILEINSQASLVEKGSFVTAAKKAGYSYEDLMEKIIKTAIKRYPCLSEA
ncbi:D-alanine--D-alanine ligase family protein [Persephonella sp.]